MTAIFTKTNKKIEIENILKVEFSDKSSSAINNELNGVVSLYFNNEDDLFIAKRNLDEGYKNSIFTEFYFSTSDSENMCIIKLNNFNVCILYNLDTEHI